MSASTCVAAAPHRVALAATGAELGAERALGEDLGAGGGGELRGAVGRVGVDDQQSVEQAGPRRGARALDGATDRRRAFARRQDRGDLAGLRREQVGRARSRRASVAARREPAAELEVAGEAALGAAVGAGRGGDPDRARAVDRDAGRGEPVLELLVLERSQPPHPADRR